MLSPGVQAKLDEWKNQLIDTTKKNRLLFFKSLRTASVRLTEPDPESLFNWLVCREKPLAFAHRDVSEPVEASLDLDLQVAREHTPLVPPAAPLLVPGEVLTDREDQQLRTVLYNLRLRGRTAVAEQGVNILFVTFGILHWLDTARQEQRTSPLILVPVELRRESALSPYRLFPIDEEVVLNPTLTFLLERDCHLTLPPLPDDLESAQFEEYCQQLDAVIGGQRGWSVQREVHLGTFSFQKLVIYKDLETNAGRLGSHPMVQALAGDPSGLEPVPELPAGMPIDDLLTPEQTFQVLDADSSQQEAIEAVKCGGSFVLQGPPGTGKSQTIANLIAEMLAAGKRILFVSEKMAALQVVHSRLRARSLDDFCLEVHSTKASKKVVLEELSKVLELKEKPAPSDTELSLSELHGLRNQLNWYARALHTRRGETCWTPRYVHGQLAQLQHLPELSFTVAEPAAVGTQKLAELNSLLARMERVRPIINQCETHPWRGCLIPEFTFAVQSDIKQQFSTLQSQLRALQTAAQTLAGGCHLPPPISLREVDRLLQISDLARETPQPPVHWFREMDLARLAREAEAHEARFRAYRERRENLLSRHRESLLSLRLDDLGELLACLNEEALKGFQKGGTPARQVIWEQVSTLKPLLDETTLSLAQLPGLVESLASYCDVPAQPTVRGAQRLLVLTTLAASDPRPTPEWFTRARLRAIRDRSRTASEVYPKLQEQRARLLSTYAPDIFTLDLDAMIHRFRVSYRGIMRILKPGYWNDVRRLRGLRRASDKLTVETALSDLELAQEVRRLEQWVRDNEAPLDAELGAWFGGDETNWSALLFAMDRTGAILDWFGQSAPPPRLIQVLTGTGNEMATMQRLHAEAATAVSRGEKVLGQLAPWVEPQFLPFGAVPFTDIEFHPLEEWLLRVRAACIGFWSARETVFQEARAPQTLMWRQAVDDLSEGHWLQKEERELGAAACDLQRDYGHFFEGVTTDWGRIKVALGWTERFQKLFDAGTVPEDLVHLVSTDPALRGPLVTSIGPCREERSRVRQGVEYVTSLFTAMIFEPRGGIDAWSLDLLGDWLAERVRRSAELEHWIDFRRIQSECEATGLQSFFTALMVSCPEEDSLRDLFYRRFYRMWLDSIYGEDPVLRQFRGREHDRLIEQFRRLDRSQWERLGPARVREAVLQRRQPIGDIISPNSEPGILMRELEKKKRHKPLRRLFSEIPNLIQEIKPCLLMSPMTVSQLLEPGKFSFDLVIFDEASQICAEEAIGAIYRGKQTVVAGDRHQLPPTRFFADGLVGAFDGQDEVEAAEEEVFESILDQCRTILPIKPLKWHYRSRHESLIAFSNFHIYSKDPRESLKTFPSARAKGPGLGVELVHVPDAIYDRGKTRRNPCEARKVAELVIQHMQQSPHRSLGVVAFSEAQQMAILAEVERLLGENQCLAELFDENRPEAFFVKNLENVQGDERDVIILNVGYGRDASGALSLNFGPLKNQGGERRLNVAITRAKYHVKVVTSLKASDLDLSRSQSQGVHLLRAFLEYAERGPTTLIRKHAAHRDETDRHFEDVVRAAIEAKGYTVVPRVGSGGYQLDLAVQSPADPDHYLLGVECDGTTYVAAAEGSSNDTPATARDRDRLTAAVLSGENGQPGLGWNLHRVWSADWIKDPSAELERIEATLSCSQEREDHPQSELPAAVPEPVSQAAAPPEDDRVAVCVSHQPKTHGLDRTARGVLPYQRAVLKRRGWSGDFYQASHSELLHALNQVLALEGPVRLIDATRRVAAAWDIRNSGRQVQAIVADAAREGISRGSFRQKDGFLWPLDMQNPPVRTHEGGEYARAIDEICLEEIAEAVILVMRQSFSLPEVDLLVQTARMLGYARTGSDVRARIMSAVEGLLRSSRLQRDGALIVLQNN